MPGKIVTFYSYKGGTGRSMALANVAWILAANNNKVLTIDWDFEAPGLHRYFLPFLRDTELEDTKGLIDLLWDYVDLALMDRSEWPIGVNDPADIADAQRYAVSLEFPFEDSQGCLHFLCAGLQDAKYGKKVRDFDWNAFYRRLGGGQFLDELRKRLKEQYDYILIDSRTGVADTSGICTIHMPDTVVLCFTYNIQSVKGIASVAESINKQRSDETSLILAPMRVPLGIEGLEEARAFAHPILSKFIPEKMETNIQEYWQKSESAFRGEYAFHEVLAVFKDPIEGRNTLLQDMEWLAGKVADKNFPIRMRSLDESVRKRYIPKIASEGNKTEPTIIEKPFSNVTANARPLHLRVFLTSPGDVTDERTLAREVIERIQFERAHRERLRLEIVAWDKPGAGTAMPAHLKPQEALEQGLWNPSACEIVVVIFGYRMGTPLSERYRKPNGERYWSGTEYEFLDALNAARQRGIPEILIYRKRGTPLVELDDPQFEEKKAQWQRVKDFFAAFSNPDGSFGSYYKTYEKPSQFKEMLDADLRDIVARYLEQQAPAAPPPPSIEEPIEEPVWRDSPYPGLRPFRTDEARIFFGRDWETDELVEKLSDPRNRLIVVVGASGSGKSSLVAAGLLPRLQKNAIPGSQDWILDRCFTPGEMGDNALLALATRLTSRLEEQKKTPRELADELAATPEKFGEWVKLLLKGRSEWAELLLFIDQFEELFTLVRSDQQGPFIKLLAVAVKTPRVRIVATLRADFFEANVQRPELAELLRDATFPLAAPVALDEMITGPARRAGLTFEKGLVERIWQDAGAEPGALSSMAWILAELYHRRSGSTLTQAAYDSFDGVQGVIRKRADETYKRLDDSAKASFDRVFNALVEVDPANGTPTRKRARRSQFETSPAALKFIDAFTQARLLVCDKDVVEVAHEKLFTTWKVLSDWIKTHREQLKAGQDLEEAAQEWQAIGKPWSGLASGARLKRYRQAINPSDLAGRFLQAGQRRLWIQRGLAGFSTSLALAVLVGAVWLYANGLTMKHGTSMLLAAVGLNHVNEPEMVELPAGEFWMGSSDDDQEASESEKPRHRVTIAKDFELGKYEVTFDEYDQFAYTTGRPLPSDQGLGRGRRPVINVSWGEAVAYAEWLSKMTSKPYRLPTEAEWEYAARAGSETSRFWGGDPNQACQYANVADQSYRQAGYSGDIFDCNDGYVLTAEEGSFKPNNFDLYDMLGNVWEFVQDSWHDSYIGAPVDGSAWEGEAGGPRVIRGGSWSSGPKQVRSSERTRLPPLLRDSSLGFRLAKTN